ncbi:DUF3426 domain-containing protein [Xanthomonas rydalmerensis]|uniref:DUF3426 domain-containing protein n=1 Tax=Xanthomonas rydalmerensis TaxID=3046274 RepID=A0ABZ0JL99_9XANT|nr:DUF3426 domain-containing protein [Xanthomonas sp. DM-2023]WOS40570.1 DUF3426 domain-containing protein [Xanthomonas sp. DM-2023]WOS44754.1 DUF3426 domain-containing protein [Xanthomonas sp. DM-2023]WOS48934.1 DUF3426 domain-containing protein [Xanthomonas sp. DM-2023]WOS53114.1 DUF3426 domain-containing protein [Xanthomonas sp. DM-2023]WOS57297.1 DUF3426 domain-containing protein [Xanthomonas sp. DM-2023]
MPDRTPPRPSLATLLRQPDPSATQDEAPVAPAAGDDAPAVALTDTAALPVAPSVSPASANAKPSKTEDDADTNAHHAARDTDLGALPSAPASATDPAPTLAPTTTAAIGTAPIAPASAATAAPSFLHGPRARRPVLHAAPWQWIALAGLGLLLALQILIADRQRLGADPRWRPWVAGVCQVLRCSVPAWREPAAFTMLSREVRPLPGHAGTLQVQATFRNDARWAQAWPLLQLSLADTDGRTIGSRVLRPQEYLGRARPDSATLEPGQSAQIAFQVREPAAETAAFSFDFH